MKLVTVKRDEMEETGVCTSSGVVLMETIKRQFDREWPVDMPTLIDSGELETLHQWFATGGLKKLEAAGRHAMAMDSILFAPLYRRPRKIWGIGLNYAEHAADLSEKTLTAIPGSFMKPDTTVIGYGDAIHIPVQSNKTTAEAELGVIIGKTCKNVRQEDWLSVVAGFTPIIDMTAEDILRQNVRYLTLSKSFDTFFSFGPELVTPDEIEDVSKLKVSTVINGKVHAENRVSNMTFPPDFLVSFLSGAMTLLPGDIISTGTPGAAVINDGDVAECRIDGFLPLTNPVKDMKKQKSKV
ncbi:MAG: fumarylacetoacetate hydrolase family protein [Deltaproteobacteria bacterium]|nr:fumarylacetoacetate hydrolase family protein [Deltaproteobacteria bacterium]